jgi:hypothetical protein
MEVRTASELVATFPPFLRAHCSCVHFCLFSDYTKGPFWFVVIKDTFYDNLRATNITAIIQDYITLAPAGSSLMTDVMNERHHIRTQAECVDGSADVSKVCNLEAYFKEPAGIPSSDPTYISRDPVYIAKAHPNQYTASQAANMVQTRFLDTIIAQDKRISYVSDKYPWIEAVHAFSNVLKEHSAYNNQADIARFNIPARKGPGDYIVYFNWQGYTDCVDVNVMDDGDPVAPGVQPVANRYGLTGSSAASEVIKMDHCEVRATAHNIIRCALGLPCTCKLILFSLIPCLSSRTSVGSPPRARSSDRRSTRRRALRSASSVDSDRAHPCRS